jgi:hypothetical protein
MIDFLIKSTGERVYEAEAHRVRGEIFAAMGDNRAESYLTKAITLAHQQFALSLELRAIVSWMNLGGFGSRDRYQRRLVSLYNKMAAEHSNSDIIDAKVELDKTRSEL